MDHRERTSEALQSRLKAVAERLLSREEFEAAVAAPISDVERDTVLELVEWFRRRYPTPAARLAYVRRAYRRWTWDVASRPGTSPRSGGPRTGLGPPNRPGQ